MPRSSACGSVWRTALLGALMALASGLAQSAMQGLDEAQMRGVTAGDGQLGAGASQAVTGLAWLQALWPTNEGSRSRLTADEFRAILAEEGVRNLPASVYNGQTVSQVRMPSAPMDVSFNLSDVLQVVGVRYDAPSMGRITLTQFDAGGTRLWVWNH